jgi:UDP-N-acetylmuramoyl-L-alanyl-D-glutamate--2,6-diaminopimelate ligase
MKLADLAAGLPAVQIVGDPDLEISSLACHTRDAAPGGLFFCLPGVRADGHAFAPQAVAGGAVALVTERALDLDVAQLVVPGARAAMAAIASRFYGSPTRDLAVYAVTGTNGKTTTAHLLASVLAAAGRRAALLGTVVNRIAGVETPVTLTTGESLDLQAMFRRMLDAGDDSVVMEASSHALALDRTAAIEFDAVMFTNLTRDHLDFHRDVDDYFVAKRRLFLVEGRRQPAAVACVNLGDEYGRRLADECRGAYGDDLWTYLSEAPDSAGRLSVMAASAVADVRACDVRLDADGSRFTLLCERLGVAIEVALPIPAHFNVDNALTAATAALATGVDPAVVARGLADAGRVPGRVDPVRSGQPFAVLVDYAHTPDSLENVLRAARGVATGRLICVFGCGGDRDRGKRPMMGAVAADLADIAVITSDNPRSEDPDAIISEIVDGIPASARAEVAVVPDRAAAIAHAIGAAASGDVVVIAGKGHETYQILPTGTIDFDDRKVAADVLAELGWRGRDDDRPAG